jgi:phosphoglycerol transferase MdoB-like AlkP superfamily enzyme
MKGRIYGLVQTYLLYVLFFVVQKPLFILFHHSLYTGTTVGEWLQVMWHGLPLDLSLAGYLTAIPAILYILSVWTHAKRVLSFWKGYYVITSALLCLIFVVNVALYGYWGFPLDATPLFYFFSSPTDALASISVWQALLGVLACIVTAALTSRLFIRRQKQNWRKLKLPYRRLTVSGVLLLLTASLFIPIRGGFSVATMNTGTAYFSSNMRLNHAAVNPAFSLMESLTKQKDFAKQYRFMPAEEAEKLMKQLTDAPLSQPHDTLLNTERPDILFVIMESFSAKLMTTLGGMSNIAVNLDSLSHEGVLFTNFYANSFRTDRGLVSILSGYPAQPTTSLMKYPHKTQSLPSISAVLKAEGYRTHYYYGGDANFTNMRSYLVSSGFETIVSDKDFPSSERHSKWGAHDEVVFNRLLSDLQQEQATDTTTAPTFRVLQTSSSHEPFKVPFRRLADDRLNAFAYTDSVIGDFVHRFRELPQWKHTLMVLVPDHLGGFDHLSHFSLERYHIPLLLIGGAVKEAKHIDVIGSQHDIAATLLAQLGIDHKPFRFSNDILNKTSPHFAFFTFPDAFGMVTKTNGLIYDCSSNKVMVDEGSIPGANLLPGKAYLQTLYDDIAAR